ncbi:preprotein translocase subunit TatC [Pseudoxanthomonas broegbernensis]|uniref:Preprotein translocase subunit TatC n=1 Tax=Pseudoxanthomonas broegbernensis TaxID=83619 RepID=A0A7V8GLY1_9GAMM|nr:group III truncated hemoglobin [Pseudoxanthomonas broegbernensis]KAF1686147.1 preprotein translocase subunit TatC [Pseudoxanthomonas broegbernensis]MBB6063850.1 hemoglobin [Pseudoxanthomonas broegbernensis]
MHAPSPSPDPGACCSEEDVVALVHRFYARVRLDPDLGPVFERHVADWPAHLAHLVDFWSALLRGTRRFSGAPMPRHMALPGLNAALFRRWLELFAQTTAELGNPAMQSEADTRARMIAERFWQQYQVAGHDVLHHCPVSSPTGETP